MIYSLLFVKNFSITFNKVKFVYYSKNIIAACRSATIEKFLVGTQ